MTALPGMHYCEEHQGNHSHYAQKNCDLCNAQKRIAELEAENRELRKGNATAWEMRAAEYEVQIRESQSDYEQLWSDFHVMKQLKEKAEAEVTRLRAGGCARNQRLTQYCAEAAEARAELAEAREKADLYRWVRGDAPEHSERWSRWDIKRWDGRSWQPLEKTALDTAILNAIAKEQKP